MTRTTLRRATAAAGGLAVALTAVCTAPGAQASTLSTTHATVVVGMRGNGHGHGLSQYGAQGAALAGLSARRIAAFYYPGTSVTTLHTSYIRVKLSSAGSTVSVQAASRMYLTGMRSFLATAGVSRYRLVADAGSGLSLQRLGSARGSSWRTVRTHLRDGTQFHRHEGQPMRLYRTDGTSIAYRGFLRAVRVHRTGTSGGLRTVNVVSLNGYTAGVVPREMPISWKPAAVEAQALAARSYGRYAVTHSSRTSSYDICDTTMCQVYGGAAKYSAHGTLLWSDALWAATATSNQVITYRHATIFAQFSASNGGWTAAGGQPYLVSKRDPYDTARSGDPYLGYRRTVATKTIAAYYGLAKLTRIEVTGRTAGGRITTASVTGVTSAHKSRTVRTDGANLSWAVGAGTTWLTFANP